MIQLQFISNNPQPVYQQKNKKKQNTIGILFFIDIIIKYYQNLT